MGQIFGAGPRDDSPGPRGGRSIRALSALQRIFPADPRETETGAWDRAETILQRVREVRARAGLGAAAAPENAGSQRLLAAAAKGRRLDKRLWTAVAVETGARGNSTALVGTPEQVADALLDYYELGVTTFLIRGFDPLEDAHDYGRELIPLTRRLVTEQIRQSASAAE